MELTWNLTRIVHAGELIIRPNQPIWKLKIRPKGTETCPLIKGKGARGKI